MTRATMAFWSSVIFAAGLSTGVWVQHRWPLGRTRNELSIAPKKSLITVAEVAKLPRERRLVLLCVGQSNAANYGEPRRASGAGVHVLFNGKLYAAIDPLPGGDGYGGSIWTRLGARLAATGHYDAVVFAVAAQGSTTAADWAEGGHSHSQLVAALRQLTEVALPVDLVLWQQGEEEGRDPGASGAAYGQNLAGIRATCRELAPQAIFLPARATYVDPLPSNEQIRLVQLVEGRQTAPGPDMDQLGKAFRRDGVHFNAQGLEAAADLWLEALNSALKNRGRSAP